jgi:hypothetical protein
MLTKAENMHRSLSHRFGFWLGKSGREYSCPLWVDKEAFTIAYLKAKGIIRPQEVR